MQAFACLFKEQAKLFCVEILECVCGRRLLRLTVCYCVVAAHFVAFVEIVSLRGRIYLVVIRRVQAISHRPRVH